MVVLVTAVTVTVPLNVESTPDTITTLPTANGCAVEVVSVATLLVRDLVMTPYPVTVATSCGFTRASHIIRSTQVSCSFPTTPST